MGNIFHDIYDGFKENEKSLMIKASGSTPEGGNEKIRSGQSYLYKKYGMNCVKSMILPYDREFSQKSLKAQATQYREILKAQMDFDYCRKEANAMIGLFDRLDGLDSYEEKQKIMAFFEGMLPLSAGSLISLVFLIEPVMGLPLQHPVIH